MGQDMWKNAFGRLDLPADKKKQVWARLAQAEAEKEYGNPMKNYRKKSVGRWVVAAVMLSCVLCIALVNIHTEGKVVEALQRLWKVDKPSRKVVERTVSYPFDSHSTPQLIDCRQERIILASSMGLIIYDREEKRVVGTIDLQKIDCCYFEGDTLQSRFLPEEDRLTIYNHRADKKEQGTCYVYHLAECRSLEEGEVKALEPAETAAVSVSLEKKWKEYTRKHQRYTREKGTLGTRALLDKKLNEGFWGCFFSDKMVSWKDASGKRYFSLLAFVSKENDISKSGKRVWHCILCSEDRDTGEQKEEMLEIKAEMPDEDVIQKEVLPAYNYQTDDPVKKALADCARENLSLYTGCFYSVYNGRHRYGKYPEISNPKGVPVVPLIDIYHVKEGKKYTKVYGTFYSFVFTRYDNTLCETMTDYNFVSRRFACAYLEKISGGYKVVKLIHPGDGEDIPETVKAMCDGDGKLARKLYKKYQKGWEKREKKIMEMIRKYVYDNQLDIQYVQFDGQDPVKLQ